MKQNTPQNAPVKKKKTATLDPRLGRFLFLFLALAFVGACARPTGPAPTDKPAPTGKIEKFNQASYRFNNALDKHLLRPLAVGYKRVTPEAGRRITTNFFNNLSYGGVILNDFLQGKIQQGMRDSFRVIVNSTFGLGGLLDLATPFGLPPNKEDFGQTLAVWGVPPGPYLYLPFLGPTTTRNLANIPLSAFLNPSNQLEAIYLYPLKGLNLINTRTDLLPLTDSIEERAIDPYTFIREAYLQRREYLVYDGAPPESDEFDALFEEEDFETEEALP